MTVVLAGDQKKAKKRKLPSASTLLIVLLMLVGVALLLYPTVSDLWNKAHQSRAVGTYKEAVASLDEWTAQQMRADAERYNLELYRKKPRFYLSEEDLEHYYATLDVTGTGIMAYIEIPKIDVMLPIYHGTSDSVLQIAAGHLEGTSLPVGGPNTHAAISGHTGQPSARLFTDLDEMEIGDYFYIHVLSKTLTYRVHNIAVVLPDELDLFAFVPGEDLFTLVTCTPYGVNSHRLLVQGTRVHEHEV